MQSLQLLLLPLQMFWHHPLCLVDQLGQKPLLYMGVGGISNSLPAPTIPLSVDLVVLGISRNCLSRCIYCLLAFSMDRLPECLFQFSAADTRSPLRRNIDPALRFLVSPYHILIKAAGNALTFAFIGFRCVTLLFMAIVPELRDAS